MAGTENASGRDLALKRCIELIAWYESQKGIQKILDNVLQVAIILAAGTTAFVASFDHTPGYKWIVVLPAVITTVATGFSTAFRFRNKYVNFASASERLKWLKLRYEIRSETNPGNPQDLEDLVNNIETIVSAELAQWSEGLLTGNIAEKKVETSPHMQGNKNAA